MTAGKDEWGWGVQYMNVRWTTKDGDDGCEFDTLEEPEPRPYTSKVVMRYMESK